MKFKCLPILLIGFLLTGCSGMQLEGPTANMSGYLLGRGFGAGVSEFAPQAADTIEINWTKMMTKRDEAGELPDPIPSEYVLLFFADSIDIIKVYYPDPYMLTSDFKAFLRNYGGVVNSEGQLVEILPIPRSVMNEVAEGWTVSRGMYLGRMVK